jgi:hypothetical protein
MQEFEKDNYFIELVYFYKELKDKIFEENNMYYSPHISTKTYTNIFKNNKFNITNFDKYFNKLSDTEKYNFTNYLISHDLIQITPLDIRVRIAEFFNNNIEYINKVLLEKKTYYKYYKENKSLRIMFHCKEYYPMYLLECNFKDDEFKNKISSLLKN